MKPKLRLTKDIEKDMREAIAVYEKKNLLTDVMFWTSILNRLIGETKNER